MKFKPSAIFRNLCDMCMIVHMLSLLSCVHSLGLGLDLGNSLNWREGESARMLIHESQSFEKKRRLIMYPTTPNKSIETVKTMHIKIYCIQVSGYRPTKLTVKAS